MNNSNEKNEDGILELWMMADAKLRDNTFEDTIMDRVSGKQTISSFERQQISSRINKIVIGYCMVAVISLTLCLWKGNLSVFLGVPDFQHAITEQFTGYYIFTITAVLLSGFCFLNYWVQSRRLNTMH